MSVLQLLIVMVESHTEADCLLFICLSLQFSKLVHHCAKEQHVDMRGVQPEDIDFKVNPPTVKFESKVPIAKPNSDRDLPKQQ